MKVLDQLFINLSSVNNIQHKFIIVGTTIEIIEKSSTKKLAMTLPKRIGDIQKRINNEQLLIVAAEGNAEQLRNLIDNRADANFSDTEGNTVLHYAVESSNLKVVQQLLGRVETELDVNIENNKNRTPLDIAREIGKQDIIEAIEEKILDDSLKVLDNLKEVTFSNIAHERNSEEKEIKEKIKRKIEVSLQALTDLTASEKDTKTFTYKNANVFLLFLEAFALQDGEIKEKEDQLIECFGQQNYELIGSLRSQFVHCKDRNKDTSEDIKIIDLKFLQQFIQKENGKVVIKKVFVDLKNYAEQVFNKLNKKQYNSDIKDLSEILLSPKFHKSNSKVTKNTEKIFKLFCDMVKAAYSINIEQVKQEEQEELEKVMFNLIVNIIPFFFEKEIPENLRKLKDLRNELLHNFHKYKNLKVRLLELKKSISNLRSNLFKYYYSENVHDLLQHMPCYIDTKRIKNDLDKKIRDLDNELQEEFHYVSAEEGRSFEYIFQESLFPKTDEDIQGLVDQYFKFMTIIDSRKEEETNQFVGEAEETDTSEEYGQLSDLRRREIFEDFMKLKQIPQHFGGKYKREKQEELKKKLDKYRITENHFDKVIKFYVEHDKSLCQETQHQVEKVKDILSLLNNISGENKQLSLKNVIDLYKASTVSLNYEDIFKRVGIVEDQIKQSIKRKLNYLPKYNEIVDISIAGKIIQINITEIVINILKMFHSSFNKYQIKFNNVKEAFNDKTFLDYLVIRDTKVVCRQNSQQKKFEFKNENYIFKIIKKLIQVEYTAPYIVSLLTKVQSDNVIERDDLKKLIEILLEKDSYIVHLAELLSIENTFHNLYEEVCNKMLEKKDINIDSMEILFKESKRVKGILVVLKERLVSEPSDKVVKLLKKFLALVNDTILYWCYLHEYKKAEEIASLEEITLTYQVLEDKDLVKNDDPIAVWYKLNFAKVKNSLGFKAKSQNRDEEAKTFYNEALEILEKVPHGSSPSIDTKQLLLLVLCRQAYTKSLLGEHEESYQKYVELWKEIAKFALDYSIDTPNYDKEIYACIKKSRKYLDLLALSNEHKKYLDILKIRHCMGYEKRWSNNKLTFEIYKEVYNGQKDFGMGGISISRTMAQIAKISYAIATEQQKKRDFQVALQYYYDSLVNEIRVLKIRKLEYRNLHPIIKEHSTKWIANILFHIARTNDELGDVKQSNDRKLKYYNTALKIHKKLFEFQKINVGEEHKYTTNCLKSIREINKKVRRLNLASNKHVIFDSTGNEIETLLSNCFELQIETFNGQRMGTETEKETLDIKLLKLDHHTDLLQKFRKIVFDFKLGRKNEIYQIVFGSKYKRTKTI